MKNSELVALCAGDREANIRFNSHVPVGSRDYRRVHFLRGSNTDGSFVAVDQYSTDETGVEWLESATTFGEFSLEIHSQAKGALARTYGRKQTFTLHFPTAC